MRVPVLLLATGLVLGACTDEGADSDPIALEDDGTTGEPAAPGTDDPGTDPGDEDDAGDGTGGEATTVDGTLAEPGTWQVGDAGTVTFSLEDGQLVLDDVSPADGWQVTEEETDDDEIDVHLERGNETYEFQVELEDGGATLKVDVDHDIDRAEPGTFDLGDAGTITVTIDGDQLVLGEVTLGEGWEVVTEEEGGDEVELDLASGDRRFDLEFELDDGRLDVRIDREVRGPA